MDIEKLIERLKKASADGSWNTLADYAHKAATAISTLQIENQALRNSANGFKAENEKLRAENIMHRNAASNYYAELEEYKDERNEALAELEQVKKKNKYSAHDVALILSDAFGDSCACNFNRNDEWLPEKCELLDACPDVVGVACWEQYLKWRGIKIKED